VSLCDGVCAFVNYIVCLVFIKRTKKTVTWHSVCVVLLCLVISVILMVVIILIYVKKLISLKHCVRTQITRLKLQKSFCDLEHGASL